ncbi:MAG: response regulator transcription factor [Anaerolineae bacterium]|nr:response regulator transcription factor [Anaerolineae bacterium]MDW8103002.1 response regulator transcription factor [Anaerolineae bacterium]
MFALLVPRDPDEGAVLALALQRADFMVIQARDLGKALKSWLERPADLILLVPPEGDPLPYVRQIRSETGVPLVLILDPISESLHCALLEAGADLVIIRPFSIPVLIAQLKALVRRASGAVPQKTPLWSTAGLTLDPISRTVEVEGKAPVRLTHLEFRLLYALMLHKGQVLPVETIVERVWGYTGRGDKDLVRGLISRLRAKIEPDPHRPRYIHTIPGVGYSFSPSE